MARVVELEHTDVNQAAATRPVAHGTRGIVTSGHSLTTMAGVRMLLSGGNAFDAAAAAGFAAAVIEPTASYTLAAEGVGPLPVTESDGLPDYIAVPRHELTDAALEGRPHRLLDPASGDGARFRFLVGTVLARGVPEPTRAAFEAEFEAGAPADRLRDRFPGVANAYTPAQWTRTFATALGSGAAFGAVWERP